MPGARVRSCQPFTRVSFMSVCQRSPCVVFQLLIMLVPPLLLLCGVVAFVALVLLPLVSANTATRHDEGLGDSPRARGTVGRLAHASLYLGVAQADGG